MTINQRSLAKTNIQMSEIGFGVASVLANPKFSDTAAISLIQRAIQQGITYFDTGSSYGGPRGGLGEKRLGQAIQSSLRQQLTLSIKAGTFYDDHNKRYKDFSHNAIESSIYRSLDRLKTDYIDILYLHGPCIKDIRCDLIEMLEKIRDKGIVRTFGINTMDNDVVLPFLDDALQIFEFFLITFNIFTPDNAALIKKITACGRSVVAGTAIGRALYSKERLKLYKLANLWYLLRALANSRKTLYKSMQLKHLHNIPGMTPVQAALYFTLSNKHIVSAVFNTTNVAHLLENIQASKIGMNDELVRKIMNSVLG